MLGEDISERLDGSKLNRSIEKKINRNLEFGNEINNGVEYKKNGK